jgi:hypothetical protein
MYYEFLSINYWVQVTRVYTLRGVGGQAVRMDISLTLYTE